MRETNVVFPGTVSARFGACATAGPLFVTVMVYVRLVPEGTGSRLSVFVTDRSADWTSVCADAVLLRAFGSAVPWLLMNALFVIVDPFAALGDTCTTSVKVAVAPFASRPVLHWARPALPTLGVVHDHPAGGVSETNVVLNGIASWRFTDVESEGPRLVAVIV